MTPTRGYKTRNASFTLAERLSLLKQIKPRVKIVDAHSSDITSTESKKDSWEQIQREFVKEHSYRQHTTAKDLRELWRRMKHRARVDVRESVKNAKLGKVRTVSEDHMGWLPADSSHKPIQKVININDLGLDAQTRYITEFVPLLEEEATVLDTRNGISDHGLTKDKGVLGGILAGTMNHEDVENGGGGPLRDIFECTDDMMEDDIVEVLEERPQPHIKEEPRETASNEEVQGTPYTQDDGSSSAGVSDGEGALGLQISSVVSQRQPVPSLIPPQDTPQDELIGDGNRQIAKSKSRELAELSVKFLRAEHEAKMELLRLKQEAAKDKRETARAKRSAYDEKRMFYFEKRKQIHDDK